MIRIIMVLISVIMAPDSFSEPTMNAIPERESIQYLMRYLDDHDPGHAKETLSISQQYQTPLVGWSPTPSDVARDALVKIGSNAVPSLADVLSNVNCDERTRLRAAQALAWIGDERAQAALLTGSSSTSPALVITCCGALAGTRHKDKATDRLLELILDTAISGDYLRQIVDHLVANKETRAVPVLIEAMKKTSAVPGDDSAKMATYGWGLEHLTGQAYGEQPILWEKWIQETKK